MGWHPLKSTVPTLSHLGLCLLLMELGRGVELGAHSSPYLLSGGSLLVEAGC